MSDLDRYVSERKKRDPDFAEGYETGYQNFRLGVILRQMREQAGLTQEDIAHRMGERKAAISGIENHAQEMRLSVLGKYAEALGKKLSIRISPAG